MASPSEAPGASFKEQGNEAFRSGQNLKAAALYTKALAEDPTNAVLYSNRSVALLNLTKLTKALADAEECIKLKPDWEKGYLRKANVVEALGRKEEALALFQRVHEIIPDNVDIINKVRLLSKATGKPEKAEAPEQEKAEKKPKSGKPNRAKPGMPGRPGRPGRAA